MKLPPSRGLPERGIIRTAVEGPTRAVLISKVGIAVTNRTLRQLHRVGDTKIEIKSKDQMYDSCVACAMPDNAPRGTKLRKASVRMMQTVISTIENYISNSWNLAKNCRIVGSTGEVKLRKKLDHCR